VGLRFFNGMRIEWRTGCLLLLVVAYLIHWDFGYAKTPGNFTQLVRETMALYFKSPQNADYKPLADKYAAYNQTIHPVGIFVTLSIHGKPRACWGSFMPDDKGPINGIIHATLGALTKEYRYPPVRADEWSSLKCQVTLIRTIEPLQTLADLNPLRDGIMVRSGGKSGILLPGEARDATYELVQAKLKAGIGPHEPLQMYRLVADVYK
jgi:uncharacterized protein